MKYHVTHIDWDTDGEDVEDLPTEAFVECDDEEEIADTLSEHFGWCINTFQYLPLS